MNLLRRSVRQADKPKAKNLATGHSGERLDLVVEREVCSVILTTEFLNTEFLNTGFLNYDQPCPICGHALPAPGNNGLPTSQFDNPATLPQSASTLPIIRGES